MGESRQHAGATVAQATWRALGTSVVLRVSEAGALAAARAMLVAELAATDLACSRFRPDSELEALNAAPGRFVGVSGLLFDAVSVALRAAALTGGAVDPTLGNAIVDAGYSRDWELLEHPHEAARSQESGSLSPDTLRGGARAFTARRVQPWERIRLRADRSAIRLPDGIRLDLGATAKAFAADRAAAAISSATGVGVLVCLGGDISVAGPVPHGGWLIFVTDDHRASARAHGQTISIGDGGLATSSTTVRRWVHDGRTMHHILDPASGNPAGGPWRTVSVAGASCVDANTASTAAIVLGAAAPQWLAAQGLPARLVSHAGDTHVLAGWPPDDAASERALVAA